MAAGGAGIRRLGRTVWTRSRARRNRRECSLHPIDDSSPSCYCYTSWWRRPPHADLLNDHHRHDSSSSALRSVFVFAQEQNTHSHQQQQQKPKMMSSFRCEMLTILTTLSLSSIYYCSRLGSKDDDPMIHPMSSSTAQSLLLQFLVRKDERSLGSWEMLLQP